jgi:hypothetical protein
MASSPFSVSATQNPLQSLMMQQALQGAGSPMPHGAPSPMQTMQPPSYTSNPVASPVTKSVLPGVMQTAPVGATGGTLGPAGANPAAGYTANPIAANPPSINPSGISSPGVPTGSYTPTPMPVGPIAAPQPAGAAAPGGTMFGQPYKPATQPSMGVPQQALQAQLMQQALAGGSPISMTGIPGNNNAYR